VPQGVHKVIVEIFITQRIADSLDDLMLRIPAALALLYPAVLYNAMDFAGVCLVDHPEDPGSATTRSVCADVEQDLGNLIFGVINLEPKLKVVVQPFNPSVNPKVGFGRKGEDDEKPDKQLWFLDQDTLEHRLHRGGLDEPRSNRTVEVGRGQPGNKTR